MKCNSGVCSAKVYMINTKQRYLIQFVAPYGGSADKTIVTVVAYNDRGEQLYTQDTQAEVDVTARSQDVLKRTKVRVPLSNNLYRDNAFSAPSFAMQAPSVCKRITTGEDGSSFLNTDGSSVSNGSCYPLNDSL